MELQLWIYYVLAILILTATPGPNILLSLTTSIQRGFAYSVYTAIGSMLVTVMIMTLSFTGLGIIIASSEFIFNIIKYLGALYLIYLGYKAFTSTQEDYKIDKDSSITKKDKLSLFLKGFIVGASNPKAIVFFIALFPQFIDPTSSMFLQYLILVGTFIVPELFWLLFYAYLGHKSSHWFLEKGRAKFFNRITGGVFIGAGVLLSTTNKS
ncbi:MAG: LysE family translocator [Campylobacterota bacterium]|nr:LysE family translocator [Campylobacterota bacterium]